MGKCLEAAARMEADQLAMAMCSPRQPAFLRHTPPQLCKVFDCKDWMHQVRHYTERVFLFCELGWLPAWTGPMK